MRKRKYTIKRQITRQFEESAFELIEEGIDLKTYPVKNFARKASTNIDSFFRRFKTIEEVVYLYYMKAFVEWFNFLKPDFFQSTNADQMTDLFREIYSFQRTLQCLLNREKTEYFKEPLHDFLYFLFSQSKSLREEEIETEIKNVYLCVAIWMKRDRSIHPRRFGRQWLYIKKQLFVEPKGKKLSYENHQFIFS